MARVKKDVQHEAAKLIDKLIDKLPDETINTCGLCNRTLYDHLTQIIVNSGASQRMVCEIFANRYNGTKREEDRIPGEAFRGRLQHISRANARELLGESHPLKTQVATQCPSPEEQSAGREIIATQSDAPAVSENGTEETQDAAPPSTQESQPSESPTDPYQVLVEYWRSKKYTAEDAYEVFLTDLLGRLSPDDVPQYKRDGGVTFDELSFIIGETVRQNEEISPEAFHRVVRSGLEDYGGWSSRNVDKAIGDKPLLPGETAPWDF